MHPMLRKLGIAAASALAVGFGAARADDPPTTDAAMWQNAAQQIARGRSAFRFDTFGDEDFWGGALRLHEAIAGAANGGVGPGLSPKAALGLGLKVDVRALPASLVAALKARRVNLDDPAVTLALLAAQRRRRRSRFHGSRREARPPSVSRARCAIAPSTTRSRPASARGATAGRTAT